MLRDVVTGTNVVFYVMLAVGLVGGLAKLVNFLTLRRMVRAASNMPKSTHKLIKLVRAKYEHACMLHDKVENTEAFVEKYIYEYRGFWLRIHTWRQLEIQAIWAAGILAVAGAAVWYTEAGICDQMYRYAAVGAAEMILLLVLSQLSDEQYKIRAVKMYMVDYLENVCAGRYQKMRQPEKEHIDVIRPDGAAARGIVRESSMAAEMAGAGERSDIRDSMSELSINIEGEPQKLKERKAGKSGGRRGIEEPEPEADVDAPELRENVIRQILEEFLA